MRCDSATDTAFALANDPAPGSDQGNIMYFFKKTL